MPTFSIFKRHYPNHTISDTIDAALLRTPLSPYRHGIASPRAYRQIHRQPPTSQPTLLFTRRKTLAAKEPRTRFRLRRVLVRTRPGSLVREHPAGSKWHSFLRPFRSIPMHPLMARPHPVRSRTQNVHLDDLAVHAENRHPATSQCSELRAIRRVWAENRLAHAFVPTVYGLYDHGVHSLPPEPGAVLSH